MAIAAQLERVLKGAGVVVAGVSIGRVVDKTTWRVEPEALQDAAQPIIDAFNPSDPAHAVDDLSDLSLATSRQKDVLAMLAVIVRERNVAAWNAMTTPQRVLAVLAAADLWKTFREFIDDKV